jgi:general stress protein 26
MMRLAVLLLLSSLLPAAGSRQPAARDLRPAARLVIQAARYATFITVDASGQPQARTVQPVQPDSDMVVWFATNPRTRKVAQLAANPRATLHYFDPATQGYVTLVGRARVVRDRAEKERHWNPAWTPHYADRDTSVVLIELRPERLEMVDIGRRVTGDPRTWTPPSMTLPVRR